MSNKLTTEEIHEFVKDVQFHQQQRGYSQGTTVTAAPSSSVNQHQVQKPKLQVQQPGSSLSSHNQQTQLQKQQQGGYSQGTTATAAPSSGLNQLQVQQPQQEINEFRKALQNCKIIMNRRQQQLQQEEQGGYSQGTTAEAAPSSGVNQHQVHQPQQPQTQTTVHKYEPKSTNGDMMQTQANKVTAPSQQQQQQVGFISVSYFRDNLGNRGE